MKPWLGVALFSLEIPGASSLKDRRQVVRSLSDGVRRHFNASISDLGPDGVWNRIDLAAACAGSARSEMEQRLAQIYGFVMRREEEGEFEILNSSQEVFPYGDL